MVNSRSRQAWDQHVEPQHLRDMALHIWGQDSAAMMEDFKPSDSLLMKYENSIAHCEKALRVKRVFVMGCNNGIYS